MFAKLPQKLTSPFGILGDDAKLAFRTQPGGIRKLAEQRVRLFSLKYSQALRVCRRTLSRPTCTGIKYVSMQFVVLHDFADASF